jgi:CRP/FNR family transcriptional regulator
MILCLNPGRQIKSTGVDELFAGSLTLLYSGDFIGMLRTADCFPRSPDLAVMQAGRQPAGPRKTPASNRAGGTNLEELLIRSQLGRVIVCPQAGSVVFRQDSPVRYSYLVIEGVVQLSYILPEGQRQIVAFRLPGDLIGLAAEGRFSAEAKTVCPVRLYQFKTDQLENFLLSNPHLQQKILDKLLIDLEVARRNFIVMGQFDATQRLVLFLLDLAKYPDFFDPETKILVLPMARHDIADYLGAAKETITRILTKLEAAGLLVRITARKLHLDLKRMHDYAGY